MSDKVLDGKVAIVTGAGGGIGRAVGADEEAVTTCRRTVPPVISSVQYPGWDSNPHNLRFKRPLLCRFSYRGMRL